MMIDGEGHLIVTNRQTSTTCSALDGDDVRSGASLRAIVAHADLRRRIVARDRNRACVEDAPRAPSPAIDASPRSRPLTIARSKSPSTV